MKIETKDIIEIGKLVRLVEANGPDNQYSKELIQYLDLLHNSIKNLEMRMEQICEISKRFI